MQQKNQKLEQDLASANHEILQLKQTESELRNMMDALRQTASVLTVSSLDKQLDKGTTC